METTDDIKKLKEIFNEEVIDGLRADKSQITHELLEKLRSFGNEGKEIALKVLDMEQDHEHYYLDSFGKRVSFDGNRRLKKAYTKMPLTKIHEEELEKCAKDIHYFKNNYVKIKTKNGINFPDFRGYQDEFIDMISNYYNEDNIGLMGRQCCNGSTTVKILNNSEEKEISFEELFNECKSEY